MHSNNFQSKNEIRLQFTQAMSKMYQQEVPLYKDLISLANDVNNQVINTSQKLSVDETHLLNLEHHGAIRVGTEKELSMMRRLFSVMGMHPVDYYDLSVAGIPVHSTAFRAIDSDDIKKSPFRVFCSLLRLDLIENTELRNQADEILENRKIFPEELLKLIELFEEQEELTNQEATKFIEHALDVFRWHENSTVDFQTYEDLKDANGLVADVVSFKGPHINHLTPKVLDIDACQNEFKNKGIKAKAFVEGPSKRKCPILLRQTSFIAIAENITFSDDKSGLHTARFGEIEQRGIALTPKGRRLYDKLLQQAKVDDSNIAYNIRLEEAFKQFPDSYEELRQQGLAYFNYSVLASKDHLETSATDIDTLIEQGLIEAKPIVYEDFLPVSAAGIFTSNLSSSSEETNKSATNVDSTKIPQGNSNQTIFEKALGTKVVKSFDLYEAMQQESIKATAMKLGINF